MQSAADSDFDTYVHARGHDLLRFAYLLTMHTQDAEDLLQTVLASVAPRWGAIRRSSDVDAYVRRALTNSAVSMHRLRLRRRERLVGTHDARLATVAGDFVETHEMLIAGLRGLPQRQRTVIVLRFYEEMTEREVALAMDCSVGTVKSQTSKALASLRRSVDLLEDVGKPPGRN